MVHRFLEDGTALAESDHSEHAWMTRYPLNRIKTYAIIANSSAMSESHCDASGLCTFTYMHNGVKAWFIGVPKVEGDASNTSSDKEFMDLTMLSANGWDLEKMDVVCVIQRENEGL